MMLIIIITARFPDDVVRKASAHLEKCAKLLYAVTFNAIMQLRSPVSIFRKLAP